MNRIITLLDQKNHYLEKFYAQNESELKNFIEGQFDGLEAFYENREKILEMIKYIDFEIQKIEIDVQKASALQWDQMKRQIAQSLKIKDLYVEKIIQQDIEVLSCIENAKNMIIKELQDLRRGKKVVGAYRTPTFQQKLDEEI